VNVDLGLLAALGVFALLGYRSGAIRQLTHWAGLAVGVLAAGPASARLTPLLAPRVGVPASITRVLLSSILFTALGGVGAWLVHALLSKLAGDRENGPGDRAFGLVLGAGKGAALLFIALSLLLFFEKPLAKAFGPPPPAVASSAAVGFVRRHGLFESAPGPAVAKLERLLAAVRDPQAARALAKDPEFQSLLDDRSLQSTLKDEELANSVLSGDLSVLKKDPRLAALLKDPRLTGSRP
jgi:uncharacterized membrane protein required for colicin V production